MHIKVVGENYNFYLKHFWYDECLATLLDKEYNLRLSIYCDIYNVNSFAAVHICVE